MKRSQSESASASVSDMLSKDVIDQIRHRKEIGVSSVSKHLHLRFREHEKLSPEFLKKCSKWLKDSIEYLKKNPEKLKQVCQNREFDGVKLTNQPSVVQELDAEYPNRDQGSHVTSMALLGGVLSREEFLGRWTVEMKPNNKLDVVGKVVGQDCRFCLDIHPGEPKDLLGTIVGDAKIPGHLSGVSIGFGSYADCVSFLDAFLDLV